ncbi:cupin [Euzebya sp.]|uniref:cupin n=1 Tax=Euzebya sp. TaxID=1971409 RepID=UPI003516C759
MTTARTADLTMLPAAVDAVLAEARDARSGRAARTLVPGAGAPLKQTLLALTAGTVLADHESPGAATIQVLRGEVRLTSGEGPQVLDAGALAPIPPMRHGLAANDDAVVLITVAVADTAPRES